MKIDDEVIDIVGDVARLYAEEGKEREADALYVAVKALHHLKDAYIHIFSLNNILRGDFDGK